MERYWSRNENRFPFWRWGLPALAAAVASGLVGCARPDRDATPPTTETPTASPTTRVRVVSAEPIPVEIEGPSSILPVGLTSFGAAEAGGALYVLGGYFGRPHAYSEAGQVGDLMRLDPKTGAWTKLGTGEKAQSVALVAHGDALVRVGGMQARNTDGEPTDLHSLDLVERFDIATSTWTELASLPEPRSSHDAIVVGDTLWVVGGWRLEGESKTWAKTILSLDLADPTATWIEVDAPMKRRALAAATVDGKIAVLGGIDEHRGISSAMNLYDPQSKTWSEGPSLPSPGFGVAAASVDGAVFASGMDGIVYRWAPGQDQWAKISTLAYPRFFHRIVPAGDDSLLVLGGIRAMESGTRVRPIERVDLNPEGEPTMLGFTLDNPMPSKNRQGIALSGDSVVMFGGNKSLGQHDFGPEFFTDAAYALDLASLEWTKLAPYPVARQTMSSFVTPWNEIVSVGGFGHDGEVARTHPEVYAYHVENNEWRQLGTLPGLGRTQFGLSVRDEEVVLFGGLDYDPRRKKSDHFRHETGLLRAEVVTQDMSFEPIEGELREPRRAFTGATLGDEYYVFGGMKEGFQLVDTCEAYDFSTKTWSPVACPNHARLSAQAVTLGDRIYLAAGSSKGEDGKLSPDPSLEVYDPATDTWTMVSETLPIEPKHVHMLGYGDRLVLLSTHNDDGLAHVLVVAPPR